MSKIHYAAGLFDGEGYVRIASRPAQNGNGRVMQVYSGIAMTDPTPLVFMQQLFGGKIHSQIRPNPKHKTLHNWNVTSQIATAFLKKVFPFLIVKKDEVALALEFQRNIDVWNHRLGNRYGYHPDRDAVMAYRQHLADEIFRLKSVVKPLVTQ